MNPIEGNSPDDWRNDSIHCGLYLHYKIKAENVKKDLIRWRGIYNSEGRFIRAELASKPGNEGQDEEPGW